MKINECLVMMCVLKHEEIKYKKKNNNQRFYKKWKRVKKSRLTIKDQINLFAKVAYFKYYLFVTFLG